MKILSKVLLCCLLLPVGLAQATLFPAVVPFESIYYVTAPSASGDRLVLGNFNDSVFSSFFSGLPLPSTPNELFEDTSIQLAPGVYLTGVYVPTAAERGGDYSSFLPVMLIDPATDPFNQPFPGNQIPTQRLADYYAFRVPAEAVLPEPSTGIVVLVGLACIVGRKRRSCP